MERKQGGLVPIGEVFGDLDGPVHAIRATSNWITTRREPMVV